MIVPGGKEAKKWLVVYTRSRAEKKVYADLTLLHIECFLPLRKQLRVYNNHRKWVDTVLISGYVFVHITRCDYDRVLQTNNVVSYVFFDRKAAVVPDMQIDAMIQMLRVPACDLEISQRTFIPGKKVIIAEGPLCGLKGELQEEHGKRRFLVRIEAIDTVFIADVPAGFLVAIPEVEPRRVESRTRMEYS